MLNRKRKSNKKRWVFYYWLFKKKDFKTIKTKTSWFNDIESNVNIFLNNIEGKKEDIKGRFSKFIDDLNKAKSKSFYLKNSGFIFQIINRKLYNYIPDNEKDSIIVNTVNTITIWYNNEVEEIKNKIYEWILWKWY